MHPPVMGVTVQQQVDRARPASGVARDVMAEDPVQVVGVPQVLVVGDRAPDGVVVDRRQHQPAGVAVGTQLRGEPGQLGLADVAVVVTVAVALRHRGVQARDHHPQVGHLEQGPRPLRGELRPGT